MVPYFCPYTQDNYVDRQLIYQFVDKQDDHVDMQLSYVDKQDDHVDMQLSYV